VPLKRSGSLRQRANCMSEQSTSVGNLNRFQFSLRQLLIAVTLFACVLSGARWYYARYYLPVRLTPEDKLADYDGRIVSLAGRYEKEKVLLGYSYTNYIHFGTERICVNFEAPHHVPEDGHFHIPEDGQQILVTGKLWVHPPQPGERWPLPEYYINDASWQDDTPHLPQERKGHL